jgi:cobalt/nickel transport protein
MHVKEIAFGLGIALVLALILSPFASPSPDGLERVAEDRGFLHKGEGEPALSSPVPDYLWPGVKSESVATSIAGLGGTLLVFFVAYGLGKAVERKS